VLVPLKESAEDLLSLQLDGNDFGDSCTEIIAQFQNLESLSLRETRLTNAGLANLARIRSLRHLNISNTHVTPDGLECLADLRLQSVSYLSTDMPDFETAAAALAKVQPRLASLSIAGSELRPEHAKALKLFRHLIRLDLLANAPQPGSMEELSDLHSLQNIRSISTAFSDPHLSALSQCSQIKVLDLSNTSITDKGVSKLRSLKELRVLHASNSISESTAQRLKRAVPGLTLYK
jgi:Leucine-rich repeat (LRR) protein